MTPSSRALTTVLCLTAGLLAAHSVQAGLDEYVQRDDGAFAWKAGTARSSPLGTVYPIALTSQVWQGIKWEHNLQYYEPADQKHPNAVLLFITGGNNDGKPGNNDEAGIALAHVCGARVAILPQVPNQPLLGGKHEDALIAETFTRYLETKDENWPLLFPMVKSAVRAMDAVQAWTKEQGRSPDLKFVVAGASKRGWTTWLTGATDKRVIAIAPMVIDTLNMKAQRAHALEVWGHYSEQIDDYTKRGLTEKFDDPVGSVLWKMVDPYSYRGRLALPKLLINGTNDRYWTLDALNIYWDDLKGPKHVVYLPNAGHNLAAHREYAINGVGALFRHAVTKRALPDLSWKHEDGDEGKLRLVVQSAPAPKSAQLWVARSATRDFRDSEWKPDPMTIAGSSVRGETSRPEKGYIALVGDLEFEIDGLPYHLSTLIRQTGAKAD